MAAKSKVLFKAVSPAGTARYAWLDKPDTSNLGKNKFKCGLVLDKGVEANDALAQRLKDAHKAEKGKADKSPVKDGDAMAEDDAEKYEALRGKWFITAKSKDKPTLVDSAKKPLTKAPRSGDLVKIAFAAATFDVDGSKGVTLYLNAVQLLERRAQEGADMFADESDSFEAEKDSNGFASEGSGESENPGHGQEGSGATTGDF